MSDDEPILRILTPGATDEEVAALVAVVAALSAKGTGQSAAELPSEWSALHRALRRPQRHGPGAWRASSLP